MRRLGLPVPLLCALALDAPPGAADGTAPEKEELPAEDKLPTAGKAREGRGYPLGEFRLTFYWVALETDHWLDEPGTMLFTQRGFPIGTFPPRFAAELTMEGTALLADGRVLNYDGRCPFGD